MRQCEFDSKQRHIHIVLVQLYRVLGSRFKAPSKTLGYEGAKRPRRMQEKCALFTLSFLC